MHNDNVEIGIDLVSHHHDHITFQTRVLKSPLGNIIARPWLDAGVLYFLQNWFFPLSRLWAAARVAEGDVDKFIESVPLKRANQRQRRQIAKALHSFNRARLRAYSTEQLWHDYFFGTEDVSLERLPIVEEMRLDNRTDYNTTRKLFHSLRKLVNTSVRAMPLTPAEVEEKYGRDGEKLEELFALPEVSPQVEVSKTIPQKYGRDYWIRFKTLSDSMDDYVYARVYEPMNIDNPPTLIFGHGICVESDHYHQLLDEISDLVNMGIRVIKPEAPWHGRRVLDGHYGGEQLLSSIPVSMIEFITAQHRDWATIIKWSRETSSGAVALGGSSLGAQTAKSIAVRARDWPKELRPDALFVTAHCSYIYEPGLDGALADIWNISPSMRACGWTYDLEKSWLQKLDPWGKPCVKGDNIVSVIGKYDKVTPAQSANEQLDFWDVPQDNRYTYRRGHFSIPLGLINDVAPLKRIAKILHRESKK